MSHLTLVSTTVKSFSILKKSLENLGLKWALPDSAKKYRLGDRNYLNGSDLSLIVVDNSKNFLFGFQLNNNQYDLVADLDFWTLHYSSDQLIRRVNQEYANNVIAYEALKQGFKVISHQSVSTGNTEIVCENWEV